MLSELRNGQFVATPHRDAVLRYETFYHSHCGLHPVTNDIITGLMKAGVYEAKYSKEQNGMLGIYNEQLEFVWTGETDSPISILVVAYKGDAPVGAALVRRVRNQPDYDHICHIFVKPLFRNEGIAKRLLDAIHRANLPGVAMQVTDLSRHVLRSRRWMIPIHPPTALDKDVRRSLRALQKGGWTNAEGSLLCHQTVIDTLEAQQALIVELRKKAPL